MGWEDWECSECGAHLHGAEPRICPECGTAGSSVAIEQQTEERTDSGYLRRTWFDVGFWHPSQIYLVDRQLLT